MLFWLQIMFVFELYVCDASVYIYMYICIYTHIYIGISLNIIRANIEFYAFFNIVKDKKKSEPCKHREKCNDVHSVCS